MPVKQEKYYDFLKKGLSKPQKIKVLKRTRELLARRGGWTQGSFWKKHYQNSEEIPAMCLAGAAQYAADELGYLKSDVEKNIFMGDYYLDSEEVANEISLLDLVQSKGFEDVPDFNDTGGTDKKDVIALIDERLAQLGEKG